MRRTLPRHSQDGRWEDAVGGDSQRPSAQTDDTDPGPWKLTDSQVLRPERKDPARGTGQPRTPWAHQEGARTDSLRSGVALRR